MRVTFLGTGSTRDPRRRCAATLVTLPDGTHVLIDTGGGNEVLLSLEAAGADVTRIRAIILTHQHLDHAAGLPFVLFQLAMATVRGQVVGQVDVCAPAPAVAGLRAACETFFPGLQNPWWLADRVRWHGCDPGDYLWRLEARDDGTNVVIPDPAVRAGQEIPDGVVAVIETMAVSHGAPPVPAQSVRIDARHADGPTRRLVVSGDTGPNLNMSRFAAGADLLVHEAVEADALGANPLLVLGSGHATAAIAGMVATVARARRLALHHLNARTGEHPEIVRAEASAHFAGEVLVPNDLDVIDV